MPIALRAIPESTPACEPSTEAKLWVRPLQVFWDTKNPEYMPVFSDYGRTTVDIAAPGMVRVLYSFLGAYESLSSAMAARGAADRKCAQARACRQAGSSCRAATCMAKFTRRSTYPGVWCLLPQDIVSTWAPASSMCQVRV